MDGALESIWTFIESIWWVKSDIFVNLSVSDEHWAISYVSALDVPCAATHELGNCCFLGNRVRSLDFIFVLGVFYVDSSRFMLIQRWLSIGHVPKPDVINTQVLVHQESLVCECIVVMPCKTNRMVTKWLICCHWSAQDLRLKWLSCVANAISVKPRENKTNMKTCPDVCANSTVLTRTYSHFCGL